MTRRKPGRIFVCLLGLWVALAPAMFAVPSAAMTLQSSMCDDGGGDCSCPDAGMDREICAFVCLSAAQFTLPFDNTELAAVFADGHETGIDPPLSGRLSTPEPAPPKIRSLL